MAAMNRGISHDLLIHPGETISDLLEERGLTQKELAKRAGVSEAFLSDVIHGKKDISKGLAMGLEYAFGVPSSFWLNLQANYDAEVLYLQEEATIQDDERAVLSQIGEVVSYLQKIGFIPKDCTENQTILSVRKQLKVSNLLAFRTLVPSGAFRISDKAKIEPAVLGAWLCLCKVKGGKRRLSSRFDTEAVDELVSEIKAVMRIRGEDTPERLTSLFETYGIDFSIVRNFRGAPVHGYIACKEDGVYQMVLTIRGAYADIFWFSLFHELGHIVNGDVSRAGNFIDAENLTDDPREKAADQFASSALLDASDYEAFVKKNRFTYSEIQKFAQSQGVPPYIVIGRLQREKHVPYQCFSNYKLRYKWAD